MKICYNLMILFLGLLTLMILFSIIIWIYFLEVQLLWKKYIAPCETRKLCLTKLLLYLDRCFYSRILHRI